ncbi:winged helix-turn-helix transcriptional regulator [Cochlodiniinecator piscidefendens]|uniref:winged helix-turn-helix transcriptional regulator n=1 Tax=Cochlodiniinecator piscidefendens TaxID=2715756 RepID=UPI00140C6FBD|nr:helix-turn-helix domain-containing protein [Cochlodiniinecator piscidefendens]
MNAKGGTNSFDGHPQVTNTNIAELNQGIDAWVENDFSGACPVRDLLDRIGDKWSVLIILRLGQQDERFRALLRAIEGISQRMLTVTLRGLERDGLVHREVFDTRPPSVVYSLTPLGVSLLGHISSLTDWALENATTVELAKSRYDANT